MCIVKLSSFLDVSKENLYELGFMNSSRMDVRYDFYCNESLNIKKNRMYIDSLLELAIDKIKSVEIEEARVKSAICGFSSYEKWQQHITRHFFILKKGSKYALASHFKVLTEFIYDEIIPPYEFDIPMFVLKTKHICTLVRASECFVEEILSANSICGCHKGFCLVSFKLIIDSEGRVVSDKYFRVEPFYGKDGDIKAMNFEMGTSADITTNYTLNAHNPSEVISKTITIEKLLDEEVKSRAESKEEQRHEYLEYISKEERRQIARDTFYALTDGTCGDFEDFDGDIDNLMNYMGN